MRTAIAELGAPMRGLMMLLLSCGALDGCHAVGAAESAASKPPVELVLQTADGDLMHLGALRGAPVLLFVFTTYDDVSQLALSVLENFLAQKPTLRTVGIAVQPTPEKLLPLYRDALDVSFVLTFDPKQSVVSGQSDLGTIDTVPSYVLLDAGGRIAAQHTGALDERGLDALLSSLER